MALIRSTSTAFPIQTGMEKLCPGLPSLNVFMFNLVWLTLRFDIYLASCHTYLCVADNFKTSVKGQKTCDVKFFIRVSLKLPLSFPLLWSLTNLSVLSLKVRLSWMVQKSKSISLPVQVCILPFEVLWILKVVICFFFPSFSGNISEI